MLKIPNNKKLVNMLTVLTIAGEMPLVAASQAGSHEGGEKTTTRETAKNGKLYMGFGHQFCNGVRREKYDKRRPSAKIVVQSFAEVFQKRRISSRKYRLVCRITYEYRQSSHSHFILRERTDVVSSQNEDLSLSAERGVKSNGNKYVENGRGKVFYATRGERKASTKAVDGRVESNCGVKRFFCPKKP